MSLRRPIFSIFFGNRSVFREADAPKAPETGPVAGAEAPKEETPAGEAEVPAARTPEQQRADLADLKEETDATRMEKTVTDYWMKNGVGKKEDAKECSPDEKGFREAIEKDRGAYALALMLTRGNVNNVKTSYYNPDSKEFKIDEIKTQFTEKEGYSKYGFYWDGNEWCCVENNASDDEVGSDFLTAWPTIVATHADRGWDELEEGNIATLQSNVAKMSQYLAMAGAEVSYSDEGKDVVDKGKKEAESFMKGRSREIVKWIKDTGQNKPVNITASKAYKDYGLFIGSETEGLFQYRYFPNENVIVGVGMSGTDKSGKMYIVDPSNENVDWRTVDGTAIRGVSDDTEKRKYLSLWYQGMSDNDKRALYLTAAPESVVGEAIEDPENEGFFLEMTKEEIKVDFGYVLVDRDGTKQKLVDAFKTALNGKKKDHSNWSDAQIAKAAELRAEKVLREADDKLKAELGDGYYDYAFVSAQKFEFTYMSGGKVQEKRGSQAKGLLEAHKKGAIEAVTDAKEKVEETLGDIIAAAIKASGNEDIDPAEVEEYVTEFGAMYGGDKKKAVEGYIKIMSMPFGLGVLVIKFIKPILNALKGSIGKMVAKAGDKAEKASKSVADGVPGGKEKKAGKPLLTVTDIQNCPRGEMVEKDKKREFADLAEEFVLPDGAFEIGEITLPDRINVTAQGHYLQKGKHKNIKLLGGVKLPKGTKLSNVRILKKPGDSMADVFPAVSAEGKYRHVAARAETATEPEVADAAPQVAAAAPKAPEPVAPAPDQDETQAA